MELALHPRLVIENLQKVIHGKSEQLELLLIAILAGGHTLLEDVPGVGKTTLAKGLAFTLGGEFRRVQFTPDLLPTDILGSSVYSPKTGEFRFSPGPIFGHVILADEINRASPRTQSALLEAMSEGQVTIEGNTATLPNPFLVIATQNPVEYHGTYPLPEAQLDRFMVRFSLGYPDIESELDMLNSQTAGHPLETLAPVLPIESLAELKSEVKKVEFSEQLKRHLLEIVDRTRSDARLRLGSSPRGSLALYRAAQARAFLMDRRYVLPDDIRKLCVPVLGHRMILQTKAKYSGDTTASILQEILETVPVPA